MNWILKLKTVLGKFWLLIFSSADFIHGVLVSIALFGDIIYAKTINLYVSLLARTNKRQSKELYFPIYIDKSSICKNVILTGRYTTSGITAPWDLQATTPSYWTALCTNSNMTAPFIMQDHVINYKKAFISDYDYTYDSGQFILYFDITAAGLDTVKKVDSSGAVKTYYVLYGISYQYDKGNNNIDGLLSSSLAIEPAAAWDMYINGATVYNTKKLLAAALDSVIVEKTGTVEKTFSEHGINYIVIGDTLYGTPNTLDSSIVTAGTVVACGTAIDGVIKTSTVQQASSAEVPGILVYTDVGELFAPNTLYALEHDTSTDEYYLPLKEIATTTITSAAYIEMCKKQTALLKYPYLNVYKYREANTNNINPYKFISGIVRRGKHCALVINKNNIPDLQPLLSFIYKCIPADGMLAIYIQAPSTSTVRLYTTTRAFASLTATTDPAIVKVSGITTAKVFI